MTVKGEYEGILEGDGMIPYVPCGRGYMTLGSCRNSQNITRK